MSNMHFREDCKSCIYNTTGLFPCQKIDKQGAIDYLTGKKEGCDEWYDEY